ncbi:MAG: ribonuclease P [Candidatus Nanoarchaeia archaeon]|jgi:ribonuclease P protein subunit RPR2
MRKYFKKREDEQSNALERIRVLFDLARQEFSKSPERANRYARMINEIIKKTRVRPNKSIRHFICSQCNQLLVPGSTLSVKSDDGFMIYTCLNCGNIKKYGYLKEKNK